MTNKSFNSGAEKEAMAEKLDSNALPDPPVMRITVVGMRRNSSKRPDGHESQGAQVCVDAVAQCSLKEDQVRPSWHQYHRSLRETDKI